MKKHRLLKRSCKVLMRKGILYPFGRIIQGLLMIYYASGMVIDSVKMKLWSLCSKSEEIDYRALEEELSADDNMLARMKYHYSVLCMFERLSFKTKLRIKMGNLSWPNVRVSEEIKAMTAKEFVQRHKTDNR